MRIDGFNKIGQILSSNNINKSKKTERGSYGDRLELSRTGNDYSFAKQVMAQIPDIREDKVNDIKERMKSGTYNVSMEEVAEKIISRYFDEQI